MKKFQKITATFLLSIFILQGMGLNFIAQAQNIPDYNKNVIRETQRLDPLLIFSNTAPKDFNESMAQAISDALGVKVSELISEDEWEELVSESIRISQEETFKELLKRVKEVISEKSRKKIVSEIDQILQATPTEYAKLAAKKEFAKYLNTSLQTNWDPLLEKFLVENAAVILTKILAESDARFLLNPEFYWHIYNTLKKFFETKVEDLPLLSDLLVIKLVDYVPGANILTDVNDFIDKQRENLKTKITNETLTRIAQPLTKAILDALAGIFPDWLGGFLEVLESTTNEILKQAISEYVDMYITKVFRDNFWVAYNFKSQLEEWVNATLKDVLPEKTQKELEKTLLEVVPDDARQFFISVMVIAKAIAEALTPPTEEVKKEMGKEIVKILFPGLEEFLNKTLYEVLCEVENFKKFCKEPIIQNLPPEFTRPLSSFIPGANTRVIDLLLPDYAELLKKKIINYLPEDERILFTTMLKDLSDEQLEKLKGYILGNRTLLSLMPDKERGALTKTLLEMMAPDTQILLKKPFRDLLPEPFRKTPFNIVGIDPSKSLLSYMSEDVNIFVGLIYQYIPDPKQREWINPILNTLNKPIKDFVSQQTTTSTLGLGQAEAAELLDTSFIELLTRGDLRDQIKTREMTDETKASSIVDLVEKQFQASGLADKLTLKIEQSKASGATQQLLTDKLGNLSEELLNIISQKVWQNKGFKQILREDPQSDQDIINSWDELEKTDWLLSKALSNGLGDILENNLKKTLRKSPLNILTEAGLRNPLTGESLFEASVLDYIKSTDPNVHKALTTGLGDLLGEYLVDQILNDNVAEENQDKSILLMIGERLYGPSLKEEIEKKIDLVGLTGNEKEILTKKLKDLLPLQRATLWQKIAPGKSIYNIMQEAGAPQIAKLNLTKLAQTNPDLHRALFEPMSNFLHSNIEKQIQNNNLTEENKQKNITLLIAEKIAGPKLENQLTRTPIDFVPFLSKTIVQILDESLPSAQEISLKIKDRLIAAQISQTTLSLLTKSTGLLSNDEKGDLWHIIASVTIDPETGEEDLTIQSLLEIVREEDGNVGALGLDKVGITELRIAPGITKPLNEFLPGALILQIWEKKDIAKEYQGKSVLDFIGESLARFSFASTLSKNFLDFLPEKVRRVLTITYGDFIKDIYPFNAKILDLLPESWRKTIKDAFGITDQDIEAAIIKAMEGIEDEISSVLHQNLAWAARTLTQITAFVFQEKLAEKIGKNILTEENMEKISQNITKVMEPIIEKAIIEPIHQGYLINTLDDIYLGP